MLDKLFNRKKQLEELVDETHGLLLELQKKLISSQHPLEINSLRRDIQKLREVAEEFYTEWMSIEKLARKYQQQLQEHIEPSKFISEKGKENAE